METKELGQKIWDCTTRLSEASAQTFQSYILGPMEKGFETARLQSPPIYVVDGVDLRVLPKFICYKAALLREKLTLQYALALLSGAFLVFFIVSRVEVSGLYSKLREKEYILAPGVQDFTPVAPQSVPTSHVQNAGMEFLETLGNINPANIDEQYGRLEESMSQELRIQFELEAAPWKARVKGENITQILAVTSKEIKTNSDGYYQVTAQVRKDSYVSSEHIGSYDQVIEMVLRLIPPKAGKRWYLEIVKLTTTDANAFQVKRGLSQGGVK